MIFICDKEIWKDKHEKRERVNRKGKIKNKREKCMNGKHQKELRRMDGEKEKKI